ncbi:hypothetical protein ElyMa_004077100 [Elysia marginata]|uniref:SMB domain-containing protein n=1 Tax=Elysia marginata TaxID=1093978 RepID=A0AAV4G7K5_9GAST|nr:hypothetical protein ElyMa_004077100 [Elysia marginata]
MFSLISLFIVAIFVENIEGTTTSTTTGHYHRVTANRTAIQDGKSQNDAYLSSSTVQTESVTPTTSSFTLSYDSQSVDCLNDATHFVYQNNLCDARDPESYIGSNKAYFSCVNRCGKPPPFTRGHRKECACDAGCVVYDDCCKDMLAACPETHSTGMMVLAGSLKYRKSFPFCADGTWLSYRCYPPGSWDHEQQSSLSTEIPDEKQTEPFYTENHLSTLEKLSTAYGQFYRVADISSGILFFNLESFESCAEPKYGPYFLPVIVSLDCSSAAAPATNRTGAATILERCGSLGVTEVDSLFHRTCSTQLISCPCKEGSYFIDHLHNACIGSNLSTVYLRHKLWAYEVRAGYADASNAQCQVHTYGNDKIFLHDTETQMSISPLLVADAYRAKLSGKTTFADDHNSFATTTAFSKFNFSNINLLNNGNSSSKNTSKSSLSRQAAQDVSWERFEARHPLTKDDLMFVVELDWTVERRVLCRSLAVYISQCEILDCAPGAILSHDPDRGGHFGGSRCLVPTHAVVKHQQRADRPAPLCWCNQVLAVLSKLGMWKIKMQVFEKNQCVIELTVRPKEKEPLEAYQLGRTASSPHPHSKWTVSFADLTTRIQKPYQNAFSAGCSLSDEIGDVLVCFHFSNVYSAEEDFKDVLCEVVWQGDNSHSMGKSGAHSLKRPFGIGVVSLLLVFMCNKKLRINTF